MKHGHVQITADTRKLPNGLPKNQSYSLTSRESFVITDKRVEQVKTSVVSAKIHAHLTLG